MPHRLVPLLALAACSYDARPARMAAPTDATAPTSLAAAIAPGPVTGGRQTWQLYVTDVSDTRISDALNRSLAARGMLARRDPRFRLGITLSDWQQPTFGDDMTVAVTLRCRLDASDTTRPHWEAEHPATHTTPLAAAPQGGARLRLAQEGAVRQGVAACLNDLAEADRKDPARFAPGAPPPEPAVAASPPA